MQRSWLLTMRNRIIFVVGLAILIVGAIFFFDETEEVLPSENFETVPARKIVNVFVSGQVKTPAVIKLEDNGDLRLVDAVNAAGGLTDFADTETINLAEPLLDGQHIHIPTKEIVFQETFAGRNGNSINLNTADETELQKIKGVGPAISKRIIDFREQNGNFESIEDVKKVRGIGEKTFEKMKDSITVK